MFKPVTDTLGLSGMTLYQTRHSGGSIDRVRGCRTLEEVQRRGQWKAFSRVTRYDKKQSSGGRPPLSPAPTRRQAGSTRATCRGMVDKATTNAAAHTRMTGKYMFDVFGGSGFLTKATNQLGFRGHVLGHKVWSQL